MEKVTKTKNKTESKTASKTVNKTESKTASKTASKKENKKSLWKILLPAILVTVVIIFVAVMSTSKKSEKVDNVINSSGVSTVSDDEVVDIFDFETNYKDRKVIVAYFSATGNTKAVAEKFADVLSCDAVAIEPVEPYTEEDLTSSDPSTRPMREKAYDPFYPPEEPEEDVEVDLNLITSLPDIKKISFNRYDTIFLGYPIWYGDAPRVIYSFVSQNNLKNKVIIPFCTSDNDDISPSDNDLANFAPDDVHFMSGRRFTKDATLDEVKKFVVEIGVDIDVWD